MPDLDQDGRPVDLGAVRLRTPGLRGQVTVHQPASPGSRAAASSTAEFIEALEHAEVSEGVTIRSDHREVTPSTGSRPGGSDDMVLEVRDPGKSFGQAVLYEAEDGTISWHFPREAAVAGMTRGGGGALTYRIPREVVVAAPGEAVPGGQRGSSAPSARRSSRCWSSRSSTRRRSTSGSPPAASRRSTVRTGCGSSRRLPSPTDFSAGRSRLAAPGRGPFAAVRARHRQQLPGGFGRIPHDVFTELYQRYGGRVLALDHPTVSVSPEETVAWLAGELAALGDRKLTVDIVPTPGAAWFRGCCPSTRS